MQQLVCEVVVGASHGELQGTAQKESSLSMAYWYMPVIPAQGRLRQEDLEFEANLGYIRRHCFRKPPYL
jgi:hypothetical protein